jgi:hypothetical protein
VLNFFKNECGGKLNKNHTRINFYLSRNKKKVWCSIKVLFNNTKLEDAPLAQKIYHLTHNISPDDIPCRPFVNLKIGYRKGKKHTIRREPSIESLSLPLIDIEETKKYLKKSIFNKSGGIVNWINDISKFNICYISSIYKYTEDLPLDTPFKFRVLFLAGVMCIKDIKCPFCLNSRKKCSYSSSVLKTCGSKECAHRYMSANAKDRKSYLSGQTIEARRKSAEKNRGRLVSTETRQKISKSLKNKWSEPGYRENIIYKNKLSGTPQRISQGIKQSILDGKFTPQSNNYFNCRDEISSNITGIKRYRSKWEKIFHEKNPNCLYESIRIPYLYKNKNKIYIVDFVDMSSRILYEIKPAAFAETELNIQKFRAAEKWCDANNFEFKLITEKEINEKK